MAAPSRLAVASALGAVYLVWGSTYLAIRFVVAELPPFLSASLRWIVAGAALYAYRRYVAKDAAPTRTNWRAAAVVGAFLILGGNGIVSWAEQVVPSGLTALLIAIVPVWIALLVFAQTRERPTPRVGVGIALGLVGVAALVGPSALAAFEGGAWSALIGAGAILAASLSWATGSLYSRRAPLPKSVLLGASMEMLAGGLILAVVGTALGEAPRLAAMRTLSLTAWLSLGFLIVFGSIVAYSAYVWLFQVARPELVATYAFVNPVVAVILGALLADEVVNASTGAAAFLIVVAVAIVVTAPKRPGGEPGAKRPAES